MMWIRRKDQRGYFDHEWLQTWHTFSFGQYHDPRFMNFESIRVINEDIIHPEKGFGEHSHHDMEILTWVLEGRLSHYDSLGNHDHIVPLQAQIMSAGTGIRHSEFNASPTRPVHLLQIWIIPENTGLEPRYDQTQLLPSDVKNRWATLASRHPTNGALKIFQDVEIYVARLDLECTLSIDIRPTRSAWIQVVRGTIRIEGEQLVAGDALAVDSPSALELTSLKDTSEVLWFDCGKKPQPITQ